MQTDIAPRVRRAPPDGIEAEAILRKCVHCGFCTATCPTYQLLGDELDGPRGRIYLMKQVLEGHAPVTRSHAGPPRPLPDLPQLRDAPARRACSTATSIDIVPARSSTHAVSSGRRREKAVRWSAQGRPDLAAVHPGDEARPDACRPLLPACAEERRFPPPGDGAARTAGPRATHPRKVLMLMGCVQPAMMPNINSATARVLDAAGIQTHRRGRSRLLRRDPPAPRTTARARSTTCAATSTRGGRWSRAWPRCRGVASRRS